MCQLLGMNSNVPTDIVFSFTGFRLRGGLTDQHADGWGIAFFEGRGVRLFHDPLPSATSPVAELVRNYPIRAEAVIAHIRKATRGEVGLANTHPFVRELWGRYWVFAHNGTVECPAELPGAPARFSPVGDTDSEQAFCWLLSRIEARLSKDASEAELFSELVAATTELGSGGTLNLLLSNGQWLFVRCATRLHYVLRQAPFAKAHLVDQDVTVDFCQVTTPRDRVAVIATLPLTDDESWTALQPGEAVLFRDGLPVRAAAPPSS